MPFESATWISELTASNPAGTDPRAQGDDHLRLLKAVLQATFPNASRAFRFPTGLAVQTGNYTVAVATDENLFVPVDATAGGRTVTLPTADAGVTLKDGFQVWVSKTDTSDNTVTVSAAQNINGTTTYAIRRQYDLVRFTYNLAANQWYAFVPFYPFVASNPQTDNYTLVPSDHEKLLPFNISTGKTLTLPSTLQAGFRCYVVKSSAAAVQLTISAAALINGAGSQALAKRYKIVMLVWDGTTWWSNHVADTSAVHPPTGTLTLESGVPKSTTNQTAKATVFYYPNNGGTIPIWDTSFNSFAAISHSTQLSIGLVSAHVIDTHYDAFSALDPADGTTLIAGSGPAWSSSAIGVGTRGSGAGTTELVYKEGIQVNANAITLRNGATTYSIPQFAATYLGTFRTTAAGQTEDSESKRFLWNRYNRSTKRLFKTDTANTWFSSLFPTWQAANANTANKVGAIFGEVMEDVAISVSVPAFHSTSLTFAAVGVGVNSTTVNSAQRFGGLVSTSGGALSAEYRGHPGSIGFHEFTWIETAVAAGNTTMHGDAGLAYMASGLVGQVWC